jgi:hypothetical protein
MKEDVLWEGLLVSEEAAVQDGVSGEIIEALNLAIVKGLLALLC